MSDWNKMSILQMRETAEAWLDAFQSALDDRQYDRVTDLLAPDGYYRDLLALDWKFTTLQGAAEARDWLPDALQRRQATNFRLQGQPSAGTLGEIADTLDFFFTFETDIALGRGHVRLVAGENGSDQPQAFTLLTTMKELKAYPEGAGANRPRGHHAHNEHGGTAFADHDPDVLIIGAGQGGLMLGARLRQLGVKALIVERSARVGDIWRKRYRTLQLHNHVSMNHFPYLPLPENWPAYLPKDKVADWMEFYARAMDLDIWTSTTFERGEYDPATRSWNVELQMADGGIRKMRPRHVVSALGVSGLPRMPEIAGLRDFEGTLIHSSQPFDDIDVEGKKAVIVGAGTSAHDIAQNFCIRGGDVTMIQRSSITVVSLEPSAERTNALYRANDGVRPVADTDLMAASIAFPLLARLQGPLSRSMQEADKELLDGLRKVGFLLDNGEDDTGFFMKQWRYHAGYYLNIGASELIADGSIKLKPGVGVDRLTATQVICSDGSALDADIVVLATGYYPLEEQVRTIFGSDVADRIGHVWGIGEDHELRNMYAPTAQENFFIVGGGFPVARIYSAFTALYLKAELSGLIPPNDRRHDPATAHMQLA